MLANVTDRINKYIEAYDNNGVLLSASDLKVDGNMNLSLGARSIQDPKVKVGDVYNVDFSDTSVSGDFNIGDVVQPYDRNFFHIVYMKFSEPLGGEISIKLNKSNLEIENIYGDGTVSGDFNLGNVGVGLSEKISEMKNIVSTNNFVSHTFVKIYDSVTLNKYSKPFSRKEYDLIKSGNFGFLLILNNVHIETDESIDLFDMSSSSDSQECPTCPTCPTHITQTPQTCPTCPSCPKCQECQECQTCQECQKCQECQTCPECSDDSTMLYVSIGLLFFLLIIVFGLYATK